MKIVVRPSPGETQLLRGYPAVVHVHGVPTGEEFNFTALTPSGTVAGRLEYKSRLGNVLEYVFWPSVFGVINFALWPRTGEGAFESMEFLDSIIRFGPRLMTRDGIQVTNRGGDTVALRAGA